MIAMDLSKQQALNVDPKSNQQTNFTGNLNQKGDTKMLLIVKEAKKPF